MAHIDQIKLSAEMVTVTHLIGWNSGNSKNESSMSSFQRYHPSWLNVIVDASVGVANVLIKQILKLANEIRILDIQGVQMMTKVKAAQPESVLFR